MNISEGRLNHLEDRSKELTKAQAVIAAVIPMVEDIQGQLESNAGWNQFEFFSPEIDMHWFIKIQKALDLLEPPSGDWRDSYRDRNEI